ncbi:MAG: hypothetical protein IJU79_03920 [Desulfovibrionaceae bacterium]|nr:hypothetical protein [Desulfovibrionaceae bacterium]
MKELKSLGKIVEKYSYPTFNNAVDAEIPNYSQLRKERHGLMAQKAQEEAAKERANNPDDEMDLLRDFIEHPEKIIAARAKAAEAKAKAQDTPSK